MADTTTPTYGLDLKLFNISETAAGLVEVVGYFDIGFSASGDFELEPGMRTNLIMSLFCERRAEPYEVSTPIMRRGWWGNLNSNTPGFEIGSKLWLLDQSRLTQSTVKLAQQYAQVGLQWLIEDGLAKAVSVTSTPTALFNSTGVQLDITITTGADVVSYKWYTVWSQTI